MSGKRELDEREKKLLDEAKAISFVVGVLYEIIVLIYKLLKTGSVKSVITEISILAVMFCGALYFYIATNQHVDKEKGTKSKRSMKLILDERQKEHISMSFAGGTFFGYLYTLFVVLYKFFKDKRFTNSYFDIGLLIVMYITIYIYHIKKKEFDLPKTITGKILPTGNAFEEKKARYKHYIWDSLITTIIFIPIDFVDERKIFIVQSQILNFFILVFIRFIMFFLINLIFGEYNVKKYNEYYDKLFDEN